MEGIGKVAATNHDLSLGGGGGVVKVDGEKGRHARGRVVAGATG